MRLPVENFARLSKGLIALTLAGSLAACGTFGGGESRPLVAASAPGNGPQADYPVLVGDPYQIGDVAYRPNDTLNYDEVGYLAVDEGAVGYTGSHHTLPVPSYAEVTSLTTGRTILVRLERRGPMASNHLLALSPAALAQLDATAETPVRVRRVNPPEEQRTMLRAGNSAPLRMDTPMSLVSVLARRLPSAPVVEAAPQPVELAMLPPESGAVEVTAEPELEPVLDLPPLAEPAPVLAEAAVTEPALDLPPIAEPAAVLAEAPLAEPVLDLPPPVEIAAAPAESGAFMVQAAAFSSQTNANRAAAALGGVVTPSGTLFRVRTGPFASRSAAEASLANVRAAGYSDARILTGG